MLHKLKNIPIKTSFAQVCKRLKLEDPDDIEIVSRLFHIAKENTNPKVLYREVFVEEIEGKTVRINGFHFESDVLAMNLKEVHRVFAYVCTCGTEVDDWSHSEKDDIMSLWLDIIKGMFLFEAGTFFREHIKKAFQFEKISTVNPGSGNAENWPISQQTLLFDMIGDVKGEIGVTLTDSFLMIPTKSTSGLLFPSETEFVNCALCSRANCPGRKAPFDPALYANTFS